MVTGVPSADVSAAATVVVVVVAVAKALVMAASKNRRSNARLPLPFRMLVEVARALCYSCRSHLGHFEILGLALTESACNGKHMFKKRLTNCASEVSGRCCHVIRSGVDLRTERQPLHHICHSCRYVVLPPHRKRTKLFKADRGTTGFLDDAQNADYTQPRFLCAASLTRSLHDVPPCYL